MLKRFLSILGCLVLTVSAAMPDRVLCRGADGHVAIEWAGAACCGANACGLEDCADGAASTMGVPCGHGGCGDCVDTPLPSTETFAYGLSIVWDLPPARLPFTGGMDLLAARFRDRADHSAAGPPLYLVQRTLLV